MNSIQAFQNLILIGGQEGDVRLWDTRTQRIVEQARCHQLAVNKVLLQFQNKNPLSVSVGEDRYIQLNAANKRQSDVMLEGPVRDVCAFGTNFFVAAGFAVVLVDLGNGRVMQKTELGVRVNCIAYDAGHVYCGLDTGEIAVLSEQLQVIERFDAHSGSVLCIKAREGQFATSDATGELMFWTI